MRLAVIAEPSRQDFNFVVHSQKNGARKRIAAKALPCFDNPYRLQFFFCTLYFLVCEWSNMLRTFYINYHGAIEMNEC